MLRLNGNIQKQANGNKCVIFHVIKIVNLCNQQRYAAKPQQYKISATENKRSLPCSLCRQKLPKYKCMQKD